jgi:hypothetical protein
MTLHANKRDGPYGLLVTEINLRINIDLDHSSPPEMRLWTAGIKLPGGPVPESYLQAGTSEVIALRNLLEMLTNLIRSNVIRSIEEFEKKS